MAKKETRLYVLYPRDPSPDKDGEIRFRPVFRHTCRYSTSDGIIRSIYPQQRAAW